MSIRIKTAITVLLIFSAGMAYLFFGLNRSNKSIIEDTNGQQKSTSMTAVRSKFVDPLPNSKSRITKKPFGIFVTPQNSPAKPERFRGYHTGVDLEIKPEELNETVQVKALCSGKLLEKKTASGYGGVAAQQCKIENQDVTVVYGHLKIDSVKVAINSTLNAGDDIGILGADKSQQTDGERKHLHLAIHKGSNVDIRGYVSSKNELSGWIDPAKFLNN